MFWGSSVLLALLASGSCAKQLYPRVTSGSLNATTTSGKSLEPTTTVFPTCCYLDSFGVEKIIWYSKIVSITVATVSTIIYQYDNTKVTSYKTIVANNTQLPNSTFDNFGTVTISGVPTDLVARAGGYAADTLIITGTVYTDPYGKVHHSPTPVWVFSDVSYVTLDPTPVSGSANTYGCPSANEVAGRSGPGIKPYPYGFFLEDDDPTYGLNYTGELFAELPVELRSWMVSHVPPSASSIWSNVATCTMGPGDGIPVAHIPVTELTAGTETTTTMTGNLGGITTSATPISTTPESDTQPTSTVNSPGETSPTSTLTSSVQTPPPVSTAGSSTSEYIPPTSSAAGIPASESKPPGSSAGNPATEIIPPTSAGNTAVLSPIVSPGGIQTSESTQNQPPNTIGSIVTGPGSPNVGPSSTPVLGTSPGAGSSPGPGNSPGSGSQTAGSGAGTGVGGNQPGTTAPPPSTVAPVFTAGGSTFTGNPGSSGTNFVIGSSTLTPGGTVVVSGSGTSAGTTFVLPTSGSAIIINGATVPIATKTVAAAATTPLLVVGSVTYTANSASAFVIGSQTLTNGGVITASGQVLSLASGGSTVVIVSGSSTKTEGLGGVINSIGGFGPSTATATYVTASGVELTKWKDVWVLGVVLTGGLLGMLVL